MRGWVRFILIATLLHTGRCQTYDTPQEVLDAVAALPQSDIDICEGERKDLDCFFIAPTCEVGDPDGGTPDYPACVCAAEMISCLAEVVTTVPKACVIWWIPSCYQLLNSALDISDGDHTSCEESLCFLPSECSNNAVETGETCDGTDLNGETCESIGDFVGGTLTCQTDCLGYDTSGCTAANVCGNGVIEAGVSEDCEGTVPDGRDCQTEGDFVAGTLQCTDCTIDTSLCVAPGCGNSVLDTGEDCDGTLGLSGRTCPSIGNFLAGGTVTCACPNFDTTACVEADVCGNNVQEAGEDCDGSDIPSSASCADNDPRTSGALSCSSCAINYSQCQDVPVVCNDGFIEGSEDCDSGIPITAACAVADPTGGWATGTDNNPGCNAITCRYVFSGFCSADVTAVCAAGTAFIGSNGLADDLHIVIDGGSRNAVTLETQPESFDCSFDGQTENIILRAISATGNDDTCATTVTIRDNSPPMISITPRAIQMTDAIVNINPRLFDSGTTDNCIGRYLIAGDIAFVGFNMDNPDTFSWVWLTDVGSGTQIHFTDNGWDGSQLTTTEGTTPFHLTWTAPFYTAAGSIITYTRSGTTPSGAFSGSHLDLDSTGDQILAFVGSFAQPRFIAAINDRGAGVWQTTLTNTRESLLPSGLIDGITAVALMEIDNGQYVGVRTGLARAELLVAINDRDNWIGSDTTRVTVLTDSFGVTGDTGFIWSVSPTVVSCNDVGTAVPLTVTVSDGRQSSSDNIVVQVDDATTVTPVCHGDFEGDLNSAGVFTLNVNDIDGTPADNCQLFTGLRRGSIVDTSNPANARLTPADIVFNCNDIGDRDISLVVVDSMNRVTTCTTTVEVRDEEPPTAHCKGEVTIDVDSSKQGIVTGSVLDNGSSDNCDSTGLTFTPNVTVVSCSDVGTIVPVRLTVTDNAGRSSSCTSRLVVRDGVQPTAHCVSGFTKAIDTSGNARVFAADINDGSVVNCPGATFQIAGAASVTYGCSDVGSQSLILRVISKSGEISQCSTTIIVADNIDPEIDCRSAVIDTRQFGDIQIEPAQLVSRAVDNCGTVHLDVQGVDSLTCESLGGIRSLTVTATDGDGNVATCESSVTLRDGVKPVVTCKPAGALDVGPLGTLTLSLEMLTVSVFDECGISSWRVPKQVLTCEDKGVKIIPVTVEDSSGNTASCLAAVDIQDTEKPRFERSIVTVDLDDTGSALLTRFKMNNVITDNCGVDSTGLKFINPSNPIFNCNDALTGTRNITVEANDGSNVHTDNVAVLVRDAMPPVASCRDRTVELDLLGKGGLDPSFVDNNSKDNCQWIERTVRGQGWELTTRPNQIEIVNLDVFKCQDMGNRDVTLIIRDRVGNVDQCISTITVKDTMAPRARCHNGNIAVGVDGTARVRPFDINQESEDNCGIDRFAVVPEEFNCNQRGNQQVTLEVYDTSQNVGTCVSTVFIEDISGPVARCGSGTFDLDESGVAVVVPSQLNDGSSDNCGGALTFTVGSDVLFGCDSISKTRTVPLVVSDASGNKNSCTANVFIRDRIKPTALCKPWKVEVTQDRTVYIVPKDIDDGSFDNCGVDMLMLNQTAFGCEHAGLTIPVELTVVDRSGNRAHCPAGVTVIDQERPIARCVDVVATLENDYVQVTASNIDGGLSIDDCGASRLVKSLTQSDFYCRDVGDNPVRLRVRDASGREHHCDATVTIQDIEKPKAICKPARISLPSTGTLEVLPDHIDKASSDNCGLAKRTVSPVYFNCEHIGAQFVRLTVEDKSGHKDNCDATVTVVDPLNVCQGGGANFCGPDSPRLASRAFYASARYPRNKKKRPIEAFKAIDGNPNVAYFFEKPKRDIRLWFQFATADVSVCEVRILLGLRHVGLPLSMQVYVALENADVDKSADYIQYHSIDINQVAPVDRNIVLPGIRGKAIMLETREMLEVDEVLGITLKSENAIIIEPGECDVVRPVTPRQAFSTVSANIDKFPLLNAMDGDAGTFWKSEKKNAAVWLQLSLNDARWCSATVTLGKWMVNRENVLLVFSVFSGDGDASTGQGYVVTHSVQLPKVTELTITLPSFFGRAIKIDSSQAILLAELVADAPSDGTVCVGSECQQVCTNAALARVNPAQVWAKSFRSDTRLPQFAVDGDEATIYSSGTKTAEPAIWFQFTSVDTTICSASIVLHKNHIGHTNTIFFFAVYRGEGDPSKGEGYRVFHTLEFAEIKDRNLEIVLPATFGRAMRVQSSTFKLIIREIRVFVPVVSTVPLRDCGIDSISTPPMAAYTDTTFTNPSAAIDGNELTRFQTGSADANRPVSLWFAFAETNELICELTVMLADSHIGDAEVRLTFGILNDGILNEPRRPSVPTNYATFDSKVITTVTRDKLAVTIHRINGRAAKVTAALGKLAISEIVVRIAPPIVIKCSKGVQVKPATSPVGPYFVNALSNYPNPFGRPANAIDNELGSFFNSGLMLADLNPSIWVVFSQFDTTMCLAFVRLSELMINENVAMTFSSFNGVGDPSSGNNYRIFWGERLNPVGVNNRIIELPEAFGRGLRVISTRPLVIEEIIVQIQNPVSTASNNGKISVQTQTRTTGSTVEEGGVSVLSHAPSYNNNNLTMEEEEMLFDMEWNDPVYGWVHGYEDAEDEEEEEEDESGHLQRKATAVHSKATTQEAQETNERDCGADCKITHNRVTTLPLIVGMMSVVVAVIIIFIHQQYKTQPIHHNNQPSTPHTTSIADDKI